MYDIFSKIAFSKIEEAIKNGEFQNLAGQGKPVTLDYLASIPPEMRSAYTILKNSGLVPQEVILLKEIGQLRERLASASDRENRDALEKKLMDTELKYNLMMETLRKNKPKG